MEISGNGSMVFTPNDKFLQILPPVRGYGSQSGRQATGFPKRRKGLDFGLVKKCQNVGMVLSHFLATQHQN